MRSTEPSDPELLAEWLEHHHEPAFRLLVTRYAVLVHMTAKRTSGDDSITAEATQLTFIALAQKAKSLATCASLGGWLHRTAMMQAKNLLRKSSRETRKRQLAAMETHTPSHDETWREMQPVLDESLAALSDKDREALLLRFYRSLTIREVAATLGIATEAAQKRIDRATERLRGKLLRRGVQTGGSLSAAMLAGFSADAQAALPVSILTSKAIASSTASAGAFVSTATFLTATALKTTSIVPPLVALTVAISWIGIQRHSIAQAETERRVMLDRLADNLGNVASPGMRSQTIETLWPINWKEMASRFDDGFTRRQFRRQMEKMSATELMRSLHEIASIDLSQIERLVLEDMIMSQLVRKDPQSALTGFIDQIGDGGPLGRLLPSALGQWMREEPEMAGAWFDAQIAAGRFDSRRLDGSDAIQTSFEAHSIAALLDSDPVAAGKRLEALTEKNRADAMRFAGTLKEMVAPRAFVELARKHLTESAQAAAISSQAQKLVQGNDYNHVTEFLDDIAATPTERAAAVKSSVSKGVSNVVTERRFTAVDLISIRNWVTAQAPELIAEVTGETLGIVSIQQSPQMEFTGIADLVHQYHEAGDGDALLIHFLDHAHAKDETQRKLCWRLAEMISVENRRAEFLQKFK